MNIGEKIKNARKEKKMTQRELAESIGKGFSTVQKYELNLIQPPVDVIEDISKVLSVSVNYLLGYESINVEEIADALQEHNFSKVEKIIGLREGSVDEDFSGKRLVDFMIRNLSYLGNDSNTFDIAKNNVLALAAKYDLTDFAQSRINSIKQNESRVTRMTKLALGTEGFTEFNKKRLNEAYDKLNEKGQIKAVENISDLTKIQEYRKENSLESKTIDFEKEKKKRELPYYTIGASAGNGNFLATNDYILIEADEYVPQEANYALCVKGDSMEPKYKNGQMIYVKTQKSVENGEIGIFCLNNDVYVKKFECENGKCMLISLNPAYDPIKINDSDEIMCFGKVLN